MAILKVAGRATPAARWDEQPSAHLMSGSAPVTHTMLRRSGEPITTRDG
jgi:hypothetical protein